VKIVNGKYVKTEEWAKPSQKRKDGTTHTKAEKSAENIANERMEQPSEKLKARQNYLRKERMASQLQKLKSGQNYLRKRNRAILTILMKARAAKGTGK
jgi:hypothetical protein